MKKGKSLAKKADFVATRTCFRFDEISANLNLEILKKIQHGLFITLDKYPRC